jgi:hypothetical protein
MENISGDIDSFMGKKSVSWIGHCNKRCPFHVDQVARMQEILGYFNS